MQGTEGSNARSGALLVFVIQTIVWESEMQCKAQKAAMQEAEHCWCLSSRQLTGSLRCNARHRSHSCCEDRGAGRQMEAGRGSVCTHRRAMKGRQRGKAAVFRHEMEAYVRSGPVAREGFLSRRKTTSRRHERPLYFMVKSVYRRTTGAGYSKKTATTPAMTRSLGKREKGAKVFIMMTWKAAATSFVKLLSTLEYDHQMMEAIAMEVSWHCM
eukprot:jgi/Antlo1/514/760